MDESRIPAPIRTIARGCLSSPEIEELLTLFPSTFLYHPVVADSDSPFIVPDELKQAGVLPNFLHLVPFEHPTFVVGEFKKRFNEIKELNRHQGDAGAPGADVTRIRIAQRQAVRELNRFLFRIDHSKDWKCAFLHRDHETNAIIELKNKYPSDILAPHRMFDVVLGRTFNKETNRWKEGETVSTCEVPLLEIWKKYSEDDLGPASIENIAFNPKKPPGLQHEGRPHQAPHEFDLYNLWRGLPNFQTGNFPTPAHVARFDELVSGFLFHLYYVICDRNLESANYILDSIAFRRMFPWQKMDVMVLITGEQGTGKSAFMQILQTLFGDLNSIYYQNPASLENRFNGSLGNKILVMLDEVSSHGPDQEQIRFGNFLKTLITSPKLDIEEKFCHIQHVDNFLWLIISSNQDVDVIPGEVLDRRVFWTAINPKAKTNLDSNYFNNLIFPYNDTSTAASRSLIQHLDTYFHWRAQQQNFFSFHPRRRPQTAALRRGILGRLRGTKRWLNETSQARNIYLGSDGPPPISRLDPVTRLMRETEGELWPTDDVYFKWLFDKFNGWQRFRRIQDPVFMDQFKKDLYEVFGHHIPQSSNPELRFRLPDPDWVRSNLIDFSRYSIS